jgi:hypothetical protein
MRAEVCRQSGQAAVAARTAVTMVTWSMDDTIRSTERPGGTNGRRRFDKDFQRLR